MTGAGEPQARVLVVDDNADFVDNLQEILGAEGYAVVCATSCAQARGALPRGADLALVDLRLPDGDGLALASELKAALPELEVILLTGHATLESAAAAVRAGAAAYLLKPCATPELLATVEQAMRQVRLQGEKRELSRRAQVAEKLAAVGTMTAGLSHEIRNPLNAAALQLSVLERRVRKLPADQQPALMEPLALVRDEIRRLDHVLEDFLQFARPVQLVTRPLDLGALVKAVADLYAADAARRQVSVDLDCSPVPAVQGDEGRLRQVLVNLTLNALDATPAGGRIRFSCRHLADDHQVELILEDSGPGVPEAILPRIFEPFFTTKTSGSGLGLPIVHAIVTQHGGVIRAENGPSGGARMVVRLPASR
jgi:signal transduction histidine kinase